METPLAHALTGHAPILLVRDVVAAAHYYRDRLGFAFERFWGEPPNFVILHRDGLHVMLSKAPADRLPPPHWKIVPGMWNAYFWCRDAAALHAEFVARGARIDYGLSDKPYGIREFGVQDLEGHDLAFGSPLQ